MPYQSSGKLPTEYASKIGHIKFVQDTHIQRLLSEFESSSATTGDPLGSLTGNIDLSGESRIKFVVAVDGGEAIVPNRVRTEKRLGFASVCALLLRVEYLEELRQNPIVDPRELATKLQEGVWYNLATLPLSGIRLPHENMRQTIRHCIDSTLHYTGLYPTLRFLTSREWNPSFVMGSGDAPHFDCQSCGQLIFLPKSALNFRCPHCGAPHTLADYLGIGGDSPDEWAREEAVQALRNVLETLTLFHFVAMWRDQPQKLDQVLFVKDGPLMLRAGLYRLVDGIRAFIQNLRNKGTPLHVVGIEKTGELVNHIEEMKVHLPSPGDYYLPTVRFMVEEVHGYNFDSKTYRNRVQYGSKVIARIGPDHVIPLDIPTGEFVLEPRPEDLMGLQSALVALAKLTSYKHENALIPVVLANSFASISQQPSGDILYSFASRLIS